MHLYAFELKPGAFEKECAIAPPLPPRHPLITAGAKMRTEAAIAIFMTTTACARWRDVARESLARTAANKRR